MSEQHQVRDGRTKNWFYLDNELIDEFGGNGKDRPGIGAYAIAVYTVLARRANDEHKCWPSYGSIAVNLHISRNTVIRAITTLEEAGLISIEQRVSHEQGKPTTTNIYTMLNIKTPGASSEYPSASQGIGSSPEGIGVVHDRVYPSAPQGPKQYPLNNTHLNNTHEQDISANAEPPKRAKARGTNHRIITISAEAERAFSYAVEWSGNDRAPKEVTKQWCETSIQAHGLKTVMVAITKAPGKPAPYLNAIMNGLTLSELSKYDEDGKPKQVQRPVNNYQQKPRSDFDGPNNYPDYAAKYGDDPKYAAYFGR